MKYLTVVIPSYQVEKYIEEALDSLLLPEVLNDIEVLVVNDGSTDRTEQIAKQYEQKYPDSVRVISKENGGHGSTINCGIQQAKGLFFKVVDGDDWVDKNGLIQLIHEVKKTECDMIVNPFFRVNDKTRKKELIFYKEVKSYYKIPFEKIKKRSDRYFMHSITFRTSILREHNIHIDEKLFYVDMEYILFPIPYIDKVCFLREPVYNYRIFTAHQSMTKENIIKRRGQHEIVLKNLIDWYGDLDNISGEKKQYILHNLAMMAMQQYKIILCQPISKAAKKEFVIFDRDLKGMEPDVYSACFGIKMWALRRFGNLFYPLFAKVVQSGELY